ncbi:putative mediator of RNA polymerase II transcription subunit 12 [Drosophila rhopaloa]|uniref:Mediator of RNA polymerase II transcription subunit 12 n=1 Tax=Drosophila rhopaloa TaxID=1041015 RepID=A0A6P4FBK2_DRORH|nr:putative mediator of RNA polymerase II transcription subunit 12 [Drosophila rhopaloa]
MKVALILGTLSAFLCLASALSPSESSGSKGNGFPKKVTTLKKRPTKTPATVPISTSRGTTLKPSKPRMKIVKAAATGSTTKAPVLTETFGNLPADDLEFIKELDKQFKLHGDKIKIKVERDNSTGSVGKNSKRTIEGDLGYGYSHPGYDYSPPKFMFYPYSQHDIPSGFAHPQPLPEEQLPEEPQQPAQQPAQHHHQNHEQVTSVTIEPSYSYELKPQTSYETQPQHTAPEQPQIDLPQDEAKGVGGGAGSGGYQEPVIVLRIPGPAKYAAHLQTLLQQYLEIRAAQYLSLLQEAEQQQQQQQQQQHVDTPQYGPPEPANYHQEVSYAHQLAPTPASVQYAPIDDVYQSYKGRHQQQLQLQQQQYEPQPYYAPMDYQQPTHFYYAQPQSHLQQQPQLYLIAMAQPEPEPEPQQHQHVHQHHQQQQQHHQQQHHQQQQHQQPIYVPESDPPTAPGGPEQEPEPEHSLPITENNPRPTHTKVIFNPYPYQQQQHQQHQQEEQHIQEQGPHSDLEEQPQSEGERPFNYHAHGLKMRPGKRAAKPEPADGEGGSNSGDVRLQQIREYVREKLGAEMGSAVEYKTTQLLEG